jgi:hypothetical protein
VAKLPEAQRRAFQVAQPLTTVAARRETPMKFERITPEKRQEIKKEATAVQTFGNERNRWEATTASQRKNSVTPHVAEHKERVQPDKERKAVSVPPVAVQRETVQPTRERKGVVTPPVVQREAPVEPSRESRARQPERVQIPASPIVGQSGRSGIILQRGPPSQPKAEVKDKEGRDLKRGWGSSR